MDVPPRKLTAWHAALGAVLLFGLLLRLKGIHDPLLDHPGWRQGDTAAIARNFATLDLNPFHPQVDYNGPPPNYVELELQIVPFLAALLYKLFGIHEVFGRLISIGFSLLTVGLLGIFARRLFRSDVAGLTAALLFAMYAGSVYYGRTFTPETAMACLATAALYAGYRWIVDATPRGATGFWLAAGLAALAILAKPVAAVVLVPIVTVAVWHSGWRAALSRPALWGYVAVALVPYLAYDGYVRSIAEWQWASGIMGRHVVPELFAAFASPHAFGQKLNQFGNALVMLRATMLGPLGFGLLVLAIVIPVRAEIRVLLGAYLLALLAYTFVVVTVERVDYYLYLWLPLAALWTGGLVGRIAELLGPNNPWNRGAVALAGVVFAGMVLLSRAAVHDYYHFDPDVHRRARALDATLPPGGLIVMAHYGPNVLYYIDRKGWEEDPLLWTPFDEESAIRKGARVFVAIEERRLRRNLDLCHWLERFPIVDPKAAWPVYLTDPARMLPGAEARWQAFRALERAGKAKPCLALRQR